VFQVYLFAKPGKEYEVKLPPKQEKSLNDILNPFFQALSIHIHILNTDSLELNFLIQSFEQKYQPYFKSRLVSFYNKLEIEPIEEFILNTDQVFINVTDKYFNDYKNYKYKVLQLLKPGTSVSIQLYSSFQGEELLYANTAYVEYFNQVFRNFMKTSLRLPGGDKIRFDIEKEKDSLGQGYEALKQTISMQLIIQDGKLLEFILLKALYDEYFNTDFNKSSLLNLIKDIEMNSEYSRHSMIARNILWKVSRLDSGKTAPEFSLTDQNGKEISLQDFRGKFVYLNFSSFACYNCLMHYPLLQEIQDKYEENLSLLTISVDNSYEGMKSGLKTKNYPWHFLFYGKQEKLLIDYNVKVFPTYVLIDPKGKLINSFAPSPLEEFETYFKEILEK
ncbi:MAG: TlpA disulfide reductase family protein, partial [Bacteroidota bacterium]|nr:TlpA disulfide reductase family protein [Bacteroidota bacterium]